MKNKFGILLAALLTTTALSAHATVTEPYAPLDANPAATEEAMAIAPGFNIPPSVESSCPCNTRNQVIDQPAMVKVAEDVRKAAAYNQYFTGPGTSPIPANSAGSNSTQ